MEVNEIIRKLENERTKKNYIFLTKAEKNTLLKYIKRLQLDTEVAVESTKIIKKEYELLYRKYKKECCQ